MQVDVTVLIIACAGAAVLAGIICWFLAIGFRKKFVEAKIGSAEEKAREIIDEALKAAEAKKRNPGDSIRGSSDPRAREKADGRCCPERRGVCPRCSDNSAARDRVSSL